MTPLVRPACLALLLAACPGDDDGGGGGGGPNPDDPCLPKTTFTGELLDWDSGGSVGFLGVFGATVVIETDTAGQDVTAPNGRFELCIPEADWAEVFPETSSPYIGGRIVVSPNILRELPTLSFRTFTQTRAADFGFDASKAHVFVHVLEGSRTVQMSSAFEADVMQTFDGMAWSAGNTGSDIYLGNIPSSGLTGSIVVSGGEWAGPTNIPIEAGRFTFVTIRAD